MATYSITTSNWNDPAFWSGMSLTNGDTLDLSALGNGFTFVFHNTNDRMVISDGITSYAIGGATNLSEDVAVASGGLNSFDTIIGPDGSTNITHGSDANNITSGSGSDTVQAGGGNDTIISGSGNDSIGAGNDNDSVDAGSGDDWVNGGDGADIIDGGTGNDFILGGDGTDTISGGLGNDTIDGGDRSDLIYGGDGDDLITDSGGSFSDDSIYGEAGNDTISGGLREDYLDGGADADTFLIDENSANDTIIGGEGGTDSDTIEGSAATSNMTVTFSGSEAGTITYGANTISFSQIENVFTGSGADSIDASAETSGVGLFGNGGNDTIIGGRGADYVEGGGGGDLAHAGDGDDSVFGGTGLDTLSGAAGNDSIDGGADDDILLGGEGGDTLLGGSGNDAFNADGIWLEPTDYPSGGGAATSLTVTNSADGPIELWWIDGSGALFQYATIQPGETYFQSTYVDDNWVLRADTGHYLRLIEGASGQTVDYGADGLDDYVEGGDGDDSVIGQFGDDTILGGSGQDSLQGGYGNDSLFGEAGNDTLIGGTGNDSLSGGDDGDTFFMENSFGTDTIIGGEGGIDEDTINLSPLTSGVTVTYTGTEAGTIISGANTITFSEVEHIILTDQADSVDATAETVSMSVDGAGGHDTIVGGSAADTLIGGAGDDSLDGNGGTDLYYGGDGNDTIDIGNNDNTAYGDADADLFLSKGSAFGKTVFGGETGDDNDTLSWSLEGDIGDEVNVIFSGDEDGTGVIRGQTVTFSEIEAIEGTNVNDTIDASATTTGKSLSGLGGNDTLTGGTGNDTILGGDGNDRLRGGAGDDSLVGGAGNDRFYTDAGADTIVGGSGSDYYYGADGFGGDVIDFGAGDVALGDGGLLGLYSVTTAVDVVFTSGTGGTATSGAGESLTFEHADLFDGAWGVGGTFDAQLADFGVTFYDYGGVTSLTGSAYDDWLVAYGADPLGITDRFVDGGAGNDNIDSGDGNDTILGGEGNDTIVSRGGNDSVDAGAGDDEIYDGAGDSTLFGGAGNDTLDGGTGSDTVDGGVGDDILFGGSGFTSDTLIGGAGNDSLNGEGGNDHLFGGDGNDTLIDSLGSDLLDGGAGNDFIQGGSGDTLIGGAGDDTVEALSNGSWATFQIDNAVGNDVLIGYEGAGDNVDNLEFFATTSSDGVTITFTTGEGGSYAYNGVSGTGTGTFTGMERIDGTDNADVFDATAVTADAWGAGAYFNIYTNGGDDLVLGSAFDDGFTLGDGDNTVYGGAGDDYVESYSNGAELMDGGTGNDSIYLYGDSGTATVDGGTGNDDIYWTGNDVTYVLQDGFGTDTLDVGRDSFDGTAGDGIDASALTNGVTVSFSFGDDGTLTEGANSIVFSGQEFFTLTAQGDSFDATNSAAGYTIDGGAGDDTLTGGITSDTLIGGDGADSITSAVLSPTSIITAGNGDTVTGTTGEDILGWSGAAGDSSTIILDDGSGTAKDADSVSDIIYVQGTGNGSTLFIEGFNRFDDKIYVSEQWTTYSQVTLASGHHEVTLTYASGDSQVFNIQHAGTTFFPSSVFDVAKLGGDIIDGGAGNDTLMGSDFADTLSGGDGDDYIDGGDGDDFLTTGLGQDTLLGGAGNDTLMNSDGDDLLIGGAGDDSIVATGGEDTLIGGTGNDTMEGGNDADTFIIEDGFGNDVITGGEGTTDGTDRDFDTIDLNALSGPVTVTYTGDEAGTITDGTDTITFTEIERIITTDQNDSVDSTAVNSGVNGDHPGINVETRGGDDTVISGWGGDTIDGGTGNDSIDAFRGDDSVIGGAGNDTLIGGSGNDTLEGGADNDSLDAGVEADTLDGGAGDDTLDAGAGDDLLTGGAGDDVLTGGDGDDTFVYDVGDGADTITDFNTGNSGALGDGDTTNNDFINLSGFYDNLTELRADFNDDGVLNQSNSTVDGGTVDYSDNSEMGAADSLTFTGADQSSFTADNTGVVCFTSGTAIRTPQGDVLIDDLRIGDLVNTMDNGAQRIRWIGRRDVEDAALLAHVKLRPVLIPKGVLGAERNLFVSRQHALLSGRDHFARAVHLTKTTKGMRIANGKRNVTYIHLMFDQHEVIFAENVPSESFYPGPLALEMFDPAMRQSFFKAFPEFLEACTKGQDTTNVFGATAREVLSRKDMMQSY